MQRSITEEEKSSNPGKHILEPQLWVSRYADYLYTYAFGRLGNQELSRDLVQDTFLAALQQTGNFRADCSERTWLTAILKYKVIDIYRKQAGAFVSKDEYGTATDGQEFFDQDDHHWKREHWPAPFGVEEKNPLDNKEFMAILQNCMQRLPPLWMSVFRLKHMDDEGTETICREMKISAANFWVIIHRAKVNLRSCLQKNWL